MSTNGESNAKAAANNQGITSTTNAQTTTTNGNTQTTTTDGNIQVTNSPETTSAASYNNQHMNGDSTVDTDNGGQSNGNGSQGGEGLGIPVIVGIVVGSVAVVLMIAAFVICGIYDLVMACTSLTPSDRPTAAKALERLQSIARETLTISSRGEETEFAL
ncbi:hypothetical protein PI125_g22730 [Phytophthora idaei]|nr:hypothetical protein PI125_g22730 [Phytophthora idaei]